MNFELNLSLVLAHTILYETKNELSPNGIVDDAVNTGIEEIAALAGVAAAVGGTAMQFEGAAQSRRSMNERMQQELQRQQGFQNTGRNLFAQSLSQSTPVARDTQMQAGQQAASQNYAKLAALPLGGDVVSPMPVNDKTIQHNVADYTGQRSAANAYLQGLGQYSVDQYVKDILANAQQGVNIGNARFSQEILPLELQQAQAKGSRTAGMGQLLAAIGSMMSAAGASGTSSSAKSAPVTKSTPSYTPPVTNFSQNYAGPFYSGIDAYNLNSLFY